MEFICKCGSIGSLIQWSDCQQGRTPRCTECHIESRPKGSDHPSWNPELTKADRYGFRGNRYNRWSRRIRRLAGHVCKTCGSLENIVAHHPYNWKDFPDKRYNVENGVALCRRCHINFHVEHGYGNNTPIQFAVFSKSMAE